MHMITKKDLNSAELETVTTSRSPTTVITANGEVQTHEEATVYVRQLDIFLTMRVLENTSSSFIARKRQRIGKTLDNESPRKHASSFIARKGLR